MGWKNLKTAFKITELVTMSENNECICIGSDFANYFATVDVKTGILHDHNTVGGVREIRFPKLFAATPDQLLDLIQTPDTFDADIPVFTFRDDEIIETLCEESGYPNQTHDGVMMHNNRYSTDRDQVVARAKKDLQSWQNILNDSITQMENDLAKEKSRLSEAQDRLAVLEATYLEKQA